MSARLLANGDLIFPPRGNPPNDTIPGYSRDPKDPWHFILILDPCKYREVKPVVQPCGKVRSTMWCNLLSLEVSSMKCDSCLDCEP